jgi:hypothetical protein
MVAARQAYEKALLIWEQLVQKDPDSPDYASGVGATLNNMAMIDLNAKHFDAAREALVCAREWQTKALAVNPRNPTYRQFLANHLTNLIEACAGLGDAAGEADARKALAELEVSDPAKAALDARLAAVIGGDAPNDNRERLQLAYRAYENELHAASARLFAVVLETDPKLADDRRAQHRYNAACAAALAAAGKGKDDPPPDYDSRSKLRQQALDWLKAELDAWSKLLGGAGAQQRAAIGQTLQHWKRDPDLAGVREPDALVKLSDEEQLEWRVLWADVDTLLKQLQDD